MPLRDPERPEDITPEQARLLGFLGAGTAGANISIHRNKDYIVQSGEVVIVDEFTGTSDARTALVGWPPPICGSQRRCQKYRPKT